MAIHAASGARGRTRRGARKWSPWLWRLALFLLLAVVALLLSIVVFRFVNPPITSVIALSKLRGFTVQQQWVPLENISRNLPMAVIAAEDGRFCAHWGVDWSAVKEAIDEGGGWAGFRGASTIPMQTIKNLYLWNRRSYVRKIVEAPLAYAISIAWPKRRVMEIYLNIVPFGPGIFGVEAASQYYFKKSAAQLTRREAVLLAATLPSPRTRNPAKPNARMLRVVRAIDRRMPAMATRADCVLPQP